MSGLSDRYLRHSLIDWFSQAEISATCIAVIGAGAIGNEVVKNLALLGVGQIDVYDFDTVEIHNLTRSVLLRESDLGQSKARSVVTRAAELDPNCTLNAITCDIRDYLNPGALSKYRAVISAVDNFDARLRLNQLCLLAGVDFINAAIDSRFVSLEVFPHSKWDIACYECNLPESTYQRIAQRYSCGGLLKRAFEERKVPTTAITASLAGAMAAAAALGLGTLAADGHSTLAAGSGANATKPEGSRRVFLDSHTMISQANTLSRHADCPACSGMSSRPTRLDPDELRVEIANNASIDSTASNRVDESGDSSDCVLLVFPEPVIASYCCARCGGDQGVQLCASQIVGRRARAFDDQLSWCPNCRQASMQIELRDRFGLTEWDELSRQLQLPGPPVPFAMAHHPGQIGFIEWASGETPDENLGPSQTAT